MIRGRTLTFPLQRVLAYKQMFLYSVGTLFCTCIALMSFVPYSLAQDTNSGETLRTVGPKIDKNSPMMLQANELINDDKNKIITAKGDVEIYYSGHALQADKIIYNLKTKKIFAQGRVRIKQPDGTVMRAEHLKLKDDFSAGFVNALFIIFKDETRIAANSATRRDGNETIFREAVFTPCKPCREDPDKNPTWRIKGRKVTHDQKKREIYYEDTTFDFLGVTLGYFPYFQHPDPTVKRKTGFLTPFPGYSNNIGGTVSVPYFFALAPHYDFTFNPLFTSKRGPLLQGRWRHRLINGQYDVEFAGIYEMNIDGDLFDDRSFYGADQRFRGSLASKGRFEAGSYWNYGWDLMYEGDDSFRRLYKLDGIRSYNRIQDLYLEGVTDRNYFGAHLYGFGGLLGDRTTSFSPKDRQAFSFPVIDYNYIYTDPLFGGELSLDTHVQTLYRPEGDDSARLTTAVNWRKELTDSIGQVFKPFAQVRGDLYGAKDYQNPITLENQDDDVKTRGVALAGLEYRFPFVAQFGGGSHVIEPIGQIIARTSSGENEDMPNEDARSLIFDDTILFETDKFSGNDRIETGVRANVGLQYVWQLYNGGSIRALAGQSFHLSGDNAYEDISDNSINYSGLGKNKSDYVTGLYFAPTEHLSIISQMRFNEGDFKLLRHDATATLKTDYISGGVRYAFVESLPEIGLPNDQHQIFGYARIPLNDNWYLNGSMRYDLEAEDQLRRSIGLGYLDDCFNIAFTYTESFVGQDRVDIDQSFAVRVWLKHLGNFGTNSNVGQ